MGYPTDLFPDSENLSDEFLCTICHDVLQDPVVIELCEHIFCKTCITKWAENSFTFPLDRHETEAMKKAPRFFLNLLNDLVVHCPFVAAGCQVPLTLGELDGHKEECEYNPENKQQCDGGCGLEIGRAHV